MPDKEEETPPKTRTEAFLRKIKGTVTISLILTIILHIAMVVIAAIHFHNCPVEPNIPIFLLVEGVLGIIAKVVGIFRECIARHCGVSHIISLLTTVDLVLIICGSFYTFKEFQPDYESASERYCNKTVYLFSFIYLILLYSILGLLLFALGCFLLGIVALDKCIDEDDVENQPQSESPLASPITG